MDPAAVEYTHLVTSDDRVVNHRSTRVEVAFFSAKLDDLTSLYILGDYPPRKIRDQQNQRARSSMHRML
eukprot:970421-Prorocentrum_minimum.AAC.4